jgi:hypothetical protein
LILDQAYDPTPIDPTSGTGLNQTGVASQGFTVGVSGTIVQVDLLLGELPPLGRQDRPDWLILELHKLSVSGGPTGLMMMSVPTHQSDIPLAEHWQSISLGAGVAVAEGDSMALVVRVELGTAAPGAKFVWRTADSDDPYPEGDRHVFISNGWQEIPGDYGFRTFVVAVPEPTVASLVWIGIIGIAIAQRKGLVS